MARILAKIIITNPKIGNIKTHWQKVIASLSTDTLKLLGHTGDAKKPLINKNAVYEANDSYFYPAIFYSALDTKYYILPLKIKISTENDQTVIRLQSLNKNKQIDSLRAYHSLSPEQKNNYFFITKQADIYNFLKEKLKTKNPIFYPPRSYKTAKALALLLGIGIFCLGVGATGFLPMPLLVLGLASAVAFSAYKTLSFVLCKTNIVKKIGNWFKSSKQNPIETKFEEEKLNSSALNSTPSPSSEPSLIADYSDEETPSSSFNLFGPPWRSRKNTSLSSSEKSSDYTSLSTIVETPAPVAYSKPKSGFCNIL